MKENAGIYLADALRKNKTLGVLDLKFNQLKDKGAGPIIDSLEENVGLFEIDLVGNDITAESLQGLEKALGKNITLFKLVLGNENIDGCGAFIGKAVRKSASLVTLCIVEASLSDEDFVDIVTALKFSRVVDFYSNKKTFGEEAQAVLPDFFRSFKMKQLQLSVNPFSSDKNPSIPQLCILGLFEQDLSDSESIAMLGSCLKNAQLQLLTLQNCKITDQGVAVFAPALRTMPRLRFLKMGYNDFQDEGLSHILPVLEESEVIETYLIPGCKIGDKGAIAFSNMLQKNTSLLFFDLSETDITHVGVDALCSAVISNSQLQGFLISSNNLDDQSAPAICRMIARDPSIHTVVFTGNSFSPSAARTFEEAMKSNTHIFRPLHATHSMNLSICLLDIMRNEADSYVKNVQFLLAGYLTIQDTKKDLVHLKHFYSVIWSFWTVPQAMPLYTKIDH
eukprot:TRINITY_DN6506_c0_g1_i3.p1 TRINITY_DN6506_c0_g1~~TRINITY_DN6506_c0_g1_i3.p1  ORF type:complete len:481 (+),score=114.34 TRINITY_DN6506_c0_g1_i3:96-1445(+)